MRLFTALDLPQDILLRMDRLLVSLRAEATINWSPLDNLHITTKFIGELAENHLDELDGVLEKLRARSPIDIEIGDLGWFPNSHAPRVLFASVRGGQALTDLAEATERELLKLGIAKDKHDFSAHLTLARIKNPAPLTPLKAKVEELKSMAVGAFRATHFYLYLSQPGSNASIYQKLRTYQFQS